MKKYFLPIIIILLVVFETIHAAGKGDESKSSKILMGLGSLGTSGEVSCSDCKTNVPPEGYYPKYGIFDFDDDNTNSDVKKSDKKTDAQKSMLSQADGLLSTLVDNLPDKSLQSGLKEYLKIVSPKSYRSNDDSVGGSNKGIVQYFKSKFSENQCYQNAAVDFYRDIAITLKKQNKCELEEKDTKASSSPTSLCFEKNCSKFKKKSMDSAYGCSKSRPSLNDRIGQGTKSYLDEGWLMRLAMKHAKSNPEAALELIGMCGHDDTAQGNFSFYDTSEAAKAKNLEQVAMLKQQKKDIDEALKKAFKNYDSNQNDVYYLSKKASFTANQIKRLSGAEGRKESLTCPPGESDFYLPGSLGGDADISSTLKEKIRTIQGDGKKDTSFIPAKHYHVYGSALLGCKMVQNGMKPEQAVIVQKQAARFYRGLRMCGSSRNQLQSREQLKVTLQVKDFEDSKEVEKKVLQIWNQKNKGEFKCEGMPVGIFEMTITQSNKTESESSRAEEKTMEKCSMLMSFGIADLETNERNIVLKKINRALGRYDVAKLYDSWYLGGGALAGFKIPCTDIRNKGPADLMKPNQGFMGKLFKPTGWSDERYESASKKLATWDVDFEWTIAQHEVGSKYGAKMCFEAKNKKNPFEEPVCLEMKGRHEESGLPGTKNKSSLQKAVQ